MSSTMLLSVGTRAIVSRSATGRDVPADVVAFPVITTPRGSTDVTRDGDVLASWNAHTSKMFETEASIDHFPAGAPNAEVVGGQLIARRDMVEHTDVITHGMIARGIRRADPPSCLPIYSLCAPANPLVEIGLAGSSRTRIGLWNTSTVLRPRQLEVLCWTYAERCPDEEYPETYWVLDSEGKPVKQIFPQECSPMGAANDSPPPSSKANIVLRVLVEEEVRKYVIPALRANAEAIRSLLWFSAQHEAPTAETPLHEGPLPQNLIPFFARLAWLAAAGSDSAAYAWLSDHYVVVGVFVGDHYVGPWSELFLSYGYCTFSSDRGSYRTTNLETMTPARAVYVDHDEEYRAAGLKEIIDFQPSEEQVAEGDLTVKWGDRFKTVCDIPSEYLLRCGRTKLLEIERVELGPSPEESEEELAALVDLHNFLEGELAAPEEMPSPPCTVKERCELVNEAFQELGIE